MEWARDSYEGLDFPRLVFLAITSKFCRGMPWACVFSLIWLVAHATEALAVDADILVEETTRETTEILFYLPYPKGSAYRVIQGPEGQFSHYGLNRWATDFEMPEGTPVCATAAGKVVCVQQRFTTTGVTTEARTRANRIIIDHGRGLFSQYLHLKPHSARVSEGELVGRGEIIALSGSSGFATCPHLHFQIQDAVGQSLPRGFVELKGKLPEVGQEYFSRNAPQPRPSTFRQSSFPRDTFTSQGIEIHDENLAGVLLRTEVTYRIQGRVKNPCHEAVLFLLPPEGGMPVWSHLFRVQSDGSFDVSLSFAGLRAAVVHWSYDRHESNHFGLAIAPVADDSTYWSDISVPVYLR